MDENYQADFAETTESAEVTTSDFESTFDDAWDSDGYDYEAPEDDGNADDASGEASDADQHEEAEPVDDNAAHKAADTKTANGNKTDAGDQRVTIKAFDEIKELNLSDPNDRNEAISLMQKGLGFDKKFEKTNNKIAEYEEFLSELAQPLGLSLDQLMDTTRARLYKIEQERAGKTVSETDALLKVQRDRAAKAKQAEETAQKATETKAEDAKKKVDNSIKDFVALYPDVKPTAIPKSVWDEVNKTGDLVGAYTRYENAKLKEENEALKQNKKNAARSTGSSKSAGAGAKKTAFDAGWDDI